MKLRYSARATRQLSDILDYLAERSPQGVNTIGRHIREAEAVIEEHPEAGSLTSRRSGVRRLYVTPYPYLIDYRVYEAEIVILRVRHTSRRPVLPN